MEGLYPRTAFLLECLVFRFGLPYISIGTFCACLTPVNTFLLERFAFALRLSIRFYWGVLRLIHACLFSFVRKRETACGRLRFYSAVGRDRQ